MLSNFNADRQSAVATVGGMGILEKLAFVVLVVICFVVVYSFVANILGWILQPSSPFVISGLLTATNGRVFSQDPSVSDSVPIQRSDNQMNGIEFSWSVWLNVTDLTSSYSYMHVFSKGDNNPVVGVDATGISGPNNAPGVYLSTATNSLVVIMNTFDAVQETVEVTNLPLSKWVHLLVRLEGQYLDVYINGTLAKRKELVGVPKQNNGSIYVCQNGGFNGYLSNLRYYNRALQPGEILSIVNKGPDLTPSKTEQKSIKNSYPDYLALDFYLQNAENKGF
jgi:hypothetical protein